MIKIQIFENLLTFKFYSHKHIMVLLAWRYEVRRQGIRNVVTLSFDPNKVHGQSKLLTV